MRPHPATCDVAVIGAGVAGMAASLFSARKGLDTVQVGNAGGILFSSGLLDLMGVFPVEEQRVWEDPWAAVEAVCEQQPDHPYAKIPRTQLRQALEELVACLAEAGLPYSAPGAENQRLITSMGTVKTTYCLPLSMRAGVEALANQTPALVVDFEGLREFSGRQVAQAASEIWPGLRATRVVFPGTEQASELYSVHLARALELTENRQDLAARIKPHLGEAAAVGLPAVLGIRRTEEILAHLQQLLDLPVFEIPMIPTSVPGLRLKEALERILSRSGVHRMVQARVRSGTDLGSGIQGGFELEIHGSVLRHTLRARAVILASGRFMGRGLAADRQRVRETIFDLPVRQPATRSEWHQTGFFDEAGHALNRAGIEVDSTFRALGRSGEVAHDRLFAAGSILAHQDWMRMKCGSGLAIATAHAAVAAAEEALDRAGREA